MNRLAFGIKAIGGFLAAFWVAIGVILQTLVILMALDVVTGLLAGFAGKALASTTAFRGLMKKAITLCVVAAVHVVTRGVGVTYGIDINLAGWVAAGFCIHEFLSIIENAGRAGVKLPKPLVGALDKLRSKDTP